jgi:GAF domain-containing protein
MTENIILPHHLKNKSEIYKAILPQIFTLWEHESDSIANLSNTTAVLKECLGHFWIGFYLLKNNELVLGPFQGTLACTRIPLGKGVCGQSALQKRTLIVPNVHEFEGHIACSSLSNSEIVIPILNDNQELKGVLDIDSIHFNEFDETDAFYLEKLCSFIAKQF